MDDILSLGFPFKSYFEGKVGGNRKNRWGMGEKNGLHIDTCWS